MMMQGLCLRVFSKNKFGDICYEENDTGTMIKLDILINTFCTIKEPSENIRGLLNTIDGSDIREYGGVSFWLSPLSVPIIPIEGDVEGAAVLLIVVHESQKYVICVSDNKPYVQLPQGKRENTDSSLIETIIREVKEELNVDLSESIIEQIGKWSYSYTNTIVHTSNWKWRTVLFASVINYDVISHLFPNGILENEITISEYTENLDEIEQVLMIPLSLDMIPERFPQIMKKKMVDGQIVSIPLEFEGHNRSIVELYTKGITIETPCYLDDFEISVGFKTFCDRLMI